MDTKNKYKSIEYYLNLEWTYTVEKHNHNGEGYFVVRVNELPGVCSDGVTINEAMDCVREAMIGVFEIYMEKGADIPVPISPEEFKGKIMYRTSPERHFKIARIAKQKHKSLSKTLDEVVDRQLA